MFNGIRMDVTVSGLPVSDPVQLQKHDLRC